MVVHGLIHFSNFTMEAGEANSGRGAKPQSIPSQATRDISQNNKNTQSNFWTSIRMLHKYYNSKNQFLWNMKFGHTLLYFK